MTSSESLLPLALGRGMDELCVSSRALGVQGPYGQPEDVRLRALEQAHVLI